MSALFFILLHYCILLAENTAFRLAVGACAGSLCRSSAVHDPALQKKRTVCSMPLR